MPYIEVHYEDDDEKREAKSLVRQIEDEIVGNEDVDVWLIDDREPVDPEAPCTHKAIGYVEAGTPSEGPHASAHTCRECMVKTQGWVQLKTGLIGIFITFPTHKD